MTLVNLNLKFDMPLEEPMVVYDRNNDEDLINNLQQTIIILLLLEMQRREINEISGNSE